MEKNILDIGEVARRSGLPVSTLRFYEEKGLIESIGPNGLRRIFGRHWNICHDRL
jgi:DNA-binding transcriptional MerR regulator